MDVSGTGLPEHILRTFERAHSVAEVVETYRATARGLLGADGITLVRREGDEVRYIAEDAVGPLWLGKSFPLPACISGLAMCDRAPIVIPDIANDPRVPFNAYMKTFVQSMIMVPVGDSDPHAAIGAYWARTNVPAEAHLALMTALAATIADTLARVETSADRLGSFMIAA